MFFAASRTRPRYVQRLCDGGKVYERRSFSEKFVWKNKLFCCPDDDRYVFSDDYVNSTADLRHYRCCPGNFLFNR